MDNRQENEISDEPSFCPNPVADTGCVEIDSVRKRLFLLMWIQVPYFILKMYFMKWPHSNSLFPGFWPIYHILFIWMLYVAWAGLHWC